MRNKEFKYFLVTVSIICLNLPAWADDDSSTSVTFMVTLPALDFELRNVDQSLNYTTNTNLIPKLKLQHGDFGISYGKMSGRLDNNIELSTTTTDFQGFFYFDSFGLDFYYQDYRGYYIERSPITQENYFPDLRLTTYTANYYYKFGGKSRISAMDTPISSPERFSTLYYFLISISDREIDSDINLIPEGDRSAFSGIESLRHFHLLNASLSVGAFFPMHYGNYYFNPGMSVGLGAPVMRFSDDLDTTYAIKVNLKASMGYAGDTYRFGLEVVNDSDAFESSEENTIQFHSIIVNFILITYTF